MSPREEFETPVPFAEGKGACPGRVAAEPSQVGRGRGSAGSSRVRAGLPAANSIRITGILRSYYLKYTEMRTDATLPILTLSTWSVPAGNEVTSAVFGPQFPAILPNAEAKTPTQHRWAASPDEAPLRSEWHSTTTKVTGRLCSLICKGFKRIDQISGALFSLK